MANKTIPQLYDVNPIANPTDAALIELSAAGVSGAANIGSLRALRRSIYAQGTLTLGVQPTAGKTMVIGAQTYQFVAGAQSLAGDITIGANVAATQASVVAAINSTDSFSNINVDVQAGNFSANRSVLTCSTPGAAGNTVPTTGTLSDNAGNSFDGTTLGTTTAGVDGTTTGAAQLDALVLKVPAQVVGRGPGTGFLDPLPDNYVLKILASDGTVLGGFDASGLLDMSKTFVFADPVGSLATVTINPNGGAGVQKGFVLIASTYNPALRVGPDGNSQVFAVSASGPGNIIQLTPINITDVAVQVYPPTGYTADAMNVFDEAGNNPVWRVLHGGAIVTAQHSAPADGDIATGEAAIWFDQTNGAAKLMVKAKQADGTVKTGSVSLT